MVRFSGSVFNIQPDGYGNMTYMYRCPGITSREEFEAWPYWPDADDLSHRTYTFFKKIVSRYGQRTCLFGQGPAYGIQESLLWAIGFERMPLWIRREKDLVKRYIDLNEEICLKTSMALLDAGVPVIIQTDDFAFKSGPFMNPKLVDEVFGPSYRRLIKAVHDRGGKYVLHSCGDNTLLFDTFISWGVDGLHAYERTSNVDIFKEKKIHGDQVTIVGGVGVDYLLTDRSTDAEVDNEVKTLIRELGPGGRFIIAPVHSLSSIPAHKLKVMVDAVARYGAYPISVS
jgi:uroporphyrinogen decarboxylase